MLKSMHQYVAALQEDLRDPLQTASAGLRDGVYRIVEPDLLVVPPQRLAALAHIHHELHEALGGDLFAMLLEQAAVVGSGSPVVAPVEAY